MKKKKQYFILTDNGWEKAEKAKPVDLGIKFVRRFKWFTHKAANGESGFSCSEVITGYSAGKGATREKAKQEAILRINRAGKEKALDVIENRRSNVFKTIFGQ